MNFALPTGPWFGHKSSQTLCGAAGGATTDAVNLASRMESTGVAGRIQVTQSVIDATKPDEFDFERRGQVCVKGIGEMETFFLNGRNVDAEDDLSLSHRSLRSKKSNSFFGSDVLEILHSMDQIPAAEPPPKSIDRSEQKLLSVPSSDDEHEFSAESLPEP